MSVIMRLGAAVVAGVVGLFVSLIAMWAIAESTQYWNPGDLVFSFGLAAAAVGLFAAAFLLVRGAGQQPSPKAGATSRPKVTTLAGLGWAVYAGGLLLEALIVWSLAAQGVGREFGEPVVGIDPEVMVGVLGAAGAGLVAIVLAWAIGVRRSWQAAVAGLLLGSGAVVTGLGMTGYWLPLVPLWPIGFAVLVSTLVATLLALRDLRTNAVGLRLRA